MRKVGAIVIGLLLVAAVGVAYNQCTQGGLCGSCPSATESCGTNLCGTTGTCPMAADCQACKCATCDGKCDDCPMMKSGKVRTVSGTVRYTRSTNKAVKVQSGEEALLLRISSTDCAKCQQALMDKIAGLEKGDEVQAWYWSCPKTSKLYLTKLSAGGEGTSEGTG